MKVYIIKYQSYDDYEIQGIESIFKTYDRAIRYLIEELDAKHLYDDNYGNDDWKFIITEEKVEE